MLRLATNIFRKFSNLPPHTTLGMPSLSPTMTTGKIMKWFKKEGDKVKPGEIMFEVETDKATLGFEVQDEVFIAKIIASETSGALPLGSPVAILVDKVDRIAAFQNYKLPTGEESKNGPSGQSLQAPETTSAEKHKESFKMSPSAHNLIEVLHIDPAEITPSGPKGHILKEDIFAYVENLKARSNSPPKSMNQELLKSVSQEAPKEEKKIGKAEETRAPRFSVSSEINLSKISQLIESTQINAFLIKTATTCCHLIPEANSKFFPAFTRFYDYVDIQVFDYSSPKLKSYFIQNSQLKRIAEIKENLKTESQGKYTFAISFSETVNEVATPNSACLLSVGPKYSKIVKENEKLVKNDFFKATLNCDHRAVDGAVGANWLKNFKSLCENPISLL